MSILKNVNYILEMNKIPCGVPDWFLIVKTAAQAAPPALLELFEPGCTDILKMRIGNSPWHLRGIRGLIKGAIKPYPLEGQKFLYKIGYYTAEKYLYWFMLADVTTSFVTNWQSLIFQEQGCQLPGAGTAYGYFAPDGYPPGSNGGLVVAPIKLRAGMGLTNNGIVINPGIQATIAWTTEWDSYPIAGQGVNVETYAHIDDDPFPVGQVKTGDPATYTKNGTGWHYFHDKPGVLAPTTYRFYMRNLGEHTVQCVHSSWNVGLYGHPTGSITWGCKPKKVAWPFPPTWWPGGE